MFKIFSRLRGFVFFNFETYCRELAYGNAGVDMTSAIGDSSYDGNGCGYGEGGFVEGGGDGSGESINDCELFSRFFSIDEARDDA